MPFAVLAALALLPSALPIAPLSGTLITDADGARSRRAFDDGLAASRAGHAATAIELLETAVGLVPDWALAHLELGIARLARDPQDGRGLAELETAVRLAPENPRARLQLGMGYARQGRSGDALASLRVALAARSDLLEAHYAVAELLADGAQWTAALAEYRAVCAREPENVGALAGLAMAAEHEGELGAAETALTTIIHLLPGVAYHRYRLAEFYERTRQPVKARQVYAELEAADPRQRKLRRLR